MAFNEEVVNIFVEQLKMSKEDILKMANRDDNKSFNSLKVCQIKDIIRIFKAKGHYNLSTTPNKPELIESLMDILSGKTSMQLADQPHQTQTKTDLRVAEHQRQIQQQRQRVLAEQQRQHQLELQRQMQQQQKRQIQQNNERVHAVQKQHLANGGHTINTPLKRRVFEDLMSQPGVNREEVLREITEACSAGREDEETLDADMLLFNIVTRREQEQLTNDGGVAMDWAALQEAALKQREDADLDRAILESEQERDVIQNRKRSRVSDLRTNTHCSIGAAEEYSRSILLSSELAESSDRLESQNTDGSDSNSSSGGGTFAPPTAAAAASCVDLTADSDDEGVGAGQTIVATDGTVSPSLRTVGSRVLQSLVRLLDAGAVEAMSSSSSSAVTMQGSNGDTIMSGDASQVVLLRAEVVQLLLLEVDALKYHRVAGVPYLRGLALHVDSALNAYGGRTPCYQQVRPESPSSSSASTATGTFINDQLRVRCEVSRVLSYLALQSRRLQRALYRLPRDGHMVPLLFRKAFQDRRLSIGFHSSMAEDGFELLDEKQQKNEEDSGGLEEGMVSGGDVLKVRADRDRSVYSEEEEEEEDSSGDDCMEDSDEE